MSEEKGKPNKKKRELLSLMLIIIPILAIFALVGYLGSSCGYGGEVGPTESAYDVTKDDLKNAIAEYRSRNYGVFPILKGTYTTTECSNCSVINVSALLIINRGILSEVPESCYLSASVNDNCGGNASVGCRNESSYIWIVDAEGKVFSYCAGAGCTTNNSGYQDVWP